MQSILYISRSLLVMPVQRHIVGDIVDFSKSWNRRYGITGTLAFTERHFAQYIEGPDESVELLMSKLRKDHRHTDIDVIDEATISERRFASWSLAFAGRQPKLEGEIGPILRRNRNNTQQARLLGWEWIGLLRSMAIGTQMEI